MGEKLKLLPHVIRWWSKYEVPNSLLDVDWDVPVDFEKGKERMIICKECDSYTKSVHMCKECGCFMPVKTLLENTTCPLEKW